jgi:hypothetical protein
MSPTKAPTKAPTNSPIQSSTPTVSPGLPTTAPVTSPTNSPSSGPTSNPTSSPTGLPVAPPTDRPSPPPTRRPTSQPVTLSPVFAGQTPAPFAATAAPNPQPLFCNPPLTPLLRETILFTEIASISAPLDLLTSGTPQNRAFEWLLDIDPAQVCPGEALNVVQRYVLALLYYSTAGENWDECGGGVSCPTVPYLSDLNVCLWYNTLCDGPDGNLIEIRLGTFYLYH